MPINILLKIYFLFLYSTNVNCIYFLLHSSFY